MEPLSTVWETLALGSVVDHLPVPNHQDLGLLQGKSEKARKSWTAHQVLSYYLQVRRNFCRQCLSSQEMPIYTTLDAG